MKKHPNKLCKPDYLLIPRRILSGCCNAKIKIGQMINTLYSYTRQYCKQFKISFLSKAKNEKNPKHKFYNFFVHSAGFEPAITLLRNILSPNTPDKLPKTFLIKCSLLESFPQLQLLL